MDDADRRELFEALDRALGSAPTMTMMDLLPPVGWGDVARRSGVEGLGLVIRSEMNELRAGYKARWPSCEVTYAARWRSSALISMARWPSWAVTLAAR
ncbi:MAG: hypothetical protein ACR2G7_10290 [Acidimicrobiales bacterium]